MKSINEKKKLKAVTEENWLPDWRNAFGLENSQLDLLNLIKSSYMHPVILMYGPEGYGKRHLALWLAAAYLCETQSACGKCPNCREVIAGLHPDIVLLEGEEGGSIKTADVARLQGLLDILSSSGLRIAVIPNCDRLTPEAANRLLKVLEEPPSQVRFILTSSRPKAMLPTVLGRCLKFKVNMPTEDSFVEWVRDLCKNSDIGVPREDVILQFIRRANRSPAVLKSMLQESGFEKSSIHQEVEKLVKGHSVQDVLRLSESLSRVGKLQVGELLQMTEWTINDLYKSKDCPMKIGEVLRRRELIYGLRKQAIRNRVQLNTQLAAESIGLVPFALKDEDQSWRI